MPAYHILALDGGGIRGLLTTILLERLEAAVPGFLSKIDLFAGTSTGGILALGLAAGLTPTTARGLYEIKGPQVFATNPVDRAVHLGNAFGAYYPNANLKRALTDFFGTKTLADLRPKVLVSAFDLDNGPNNPAPLRSWKPKFFHNYPGPGSDGHELVVDVAMRTAAAPSFFPVYQGYADGGLFANNPSMAALAQALEPSTGGQNQADISLLSLGTGRGNQYLTTQNADWGWVQWAPHIIDILLGSSSGVAEYECRQLLGPRFHRLDPLLPEAIGLGDVDKIPRLVDIAERVMLEATIDWLKPNSAPAPGAAKFAGWVR